MDLLLTDIKSRGCSQSEAVLVLQVYSELCEIKKYWDVNYNYDNTHGGFLIASKSKSSLEECFIPLPVHKILNFIKIQELLKHFDKYHRVFLVFVSTDSTCVYYEIAKGLLEITDTQAKHLKEDKHEIINSELKRNQKVLEEAALCGSSVSLSRKSIKR